ncbi:MAG: hypothetical protein R8J84_01130 [Mariprofundales bacterium]
MDQQQMEYLQGTWKRQMRIYGIAMTVGLLLFVWCVPQLRTAGLEHVPSWLLWLSIAAGLATLGGLFGFCLALFFSLWHQKQESAE